jgi:micrococcal nuclease
VSSVPFVGVDTPETNSANAPGEFPGVPDTEAGRQCLREAGQAATAFTAERVEGERVGLRFDPNLDRRGYHGRLLAYVVADGSTLNRELVERGHARVYDAPFAERERFESAVDAAVDAGRGLWRCADPDAGGTDGGGDGDAPLWIVRITADAPDNDNENLNDETVTFENAGDATLDLTGWTVSDAAGREYRFPDGFTLDPGDRVTLHTGSGTDSADDLYWGLGGAVWNNDGDTVTVRDADGEVVAERSY